MAAPNVQIIGANQVVIHAEEGDYLQSYQTVVALRKGGSGIVLDPKWDCSRTTAKHVAQFLGINSAEIRRLIKIGEITVEGLNNG